MVGKMNTYMATLSCIWFIELLTTIALKENILNFNLISTAFLIFLFGFSSNIQT